MPPLRETLELAGVRPERVQAELAAKDRAKQARLYSGHAASVAHSGPGSGSGGGSGAAMAGAPTSSSSAAASGAAAADGGTQPATPAAATTAPHSPAVEPERGSAEWLAAQQAWEDAHLGQFERVMPPPDPQLVRWGRGREGRGREGRDWCAYLALASEQLTMILMLATLRGRWHLPTY